MPQIRSSEFHPSNTDAQITDQPTDHEKGEEVRHSDWSLADILEFSPEAKSKSGIVETYTHYPEVTNGVIRIEFSDRKHRISFKTENSDYFIELVKSREPTNTTYKTTDLGQIIDLDEFDMQISIQSPDGQGLSEVAIEFDEFITTWVDEPLTSLGLAGLLQNHDIPNELTAEYAHQLIDLGRIRIGDRTIPVDLALSRESLITHVPDAKEGKRQIFHGVSLTGALGIARIGLFSENPGYVRPILSARPDVLAAKLAMDEWSGKPREDPSDYGAIIVFDVNEDEVKSHGEAIGRGIREEIFQPAKGLKDDNERYRLQKNVTSATLPTNNPGYIPPERISKIILIKQTHESW